MRLGLMLAVATASVAACGATATPTAPRAETSSPTRPATASATPARTQLPAVTPDIALPPTMPPAADVGSNLREPGTLTVCLTVVGDPATGLDEQGQLVGYNVSIAKEIADRLGLALATREPLFDDLIDTVRDHQCDISVSSQNLTSGRLGLVDFVVYTESVQPVLVATGNPSAINTLIDLCGKPVSAAQGTTHVDLVNGTGDYIRQGLNLSCESTGLPLVDLRTFETESHAVTALLRGEVVAYLGNSGFAFEFPGQIQFSDATLPPARQGITMARDRPILRTAVEATLGAMFVDGTYRAILLEHLPNEESVRVVSIVE